MSFVKKGTIKSLIKPSGVLKAQNLTLTSLFLYKEVMDYYLTIFLSNPKIVPLK